MSLRALPQVLLRLNPFLPTCRPHSASLCSRPLLASFSSSWTAVVAGHWANASLDRMRSEDGEKEAAEPSLDNLIRYFLTFKTVLLFKPSAVEAQGPWRFDLPISPSRPAVLVCIHFQHQSLIMCGTAHGDQFDLCKWCSLGSLEDSGPFVWQLFGGYKRTRLQWKCLHPSRSFSSLWSLHFYWKCIVLSRLNDCASCTRKEAQSQRNGDWFTRRGGRKAAPEGLKREDLACFRQEVGGDSEKNLRKTVSSSP